MLCSLSVRRITAAVTRESSTTSTRYCSRGSAPDRGCGTALRPRPISVDGDVDAVARRHHRFHRPPDLPGGRTTGWLEPLPARWQCVWLHRCFRTVLEAKTIASGCSSCGNASIQPNRRGRKPKCPSCAASPSASLLLPRLATSPHGTRAHPLRVGHGRPSLSTWRSPTGWREDANGAEQGVDLRCNWRISASGKGAPSPKRASAAVSSPEVNAQARQTQAPQLLAGEAVQRHRKLHELLSR